MTIIITISIAIPVTVTVIVIVIVTVIVIVIVISIVIVIVISIVIAIVIVIVNMFITVDDRKIKRNVGLFLFFHSLNIFYCCPLSIFSSFAAILRPIGVVKLTTKRFRQQ